MVKIIVRFSKFNLPKFRFNVNYSLLIACFFLFFYFFLSFYFRHPFVAPRFIDCFDPNFNLADVNLLSASGCTYSYYNYLFLRPFTFLSADDYHLGIVVFFLFLLFVNFFIISRVSRILRLNTVLLLFLSLLFFDAGFTLNVDKAGTEQFISFTLINLGVLFFVLGGNKNLFFSGLFIALSSFKPQPIVLFFGMFFSLFFRDCVFSNFKLRLAFKKSHLFSSLYFFFGGFIIFVSYLFNSVYYLQGVYLASVSRVFDFTQFNFKYAFYFLVFIYVLLSKKKTLLSKSYLFSFPFIFLSSIYAGSGSRFFDVFSFFVFVLIVGDKFFARFFKVFLVFLFIINSYVVLTNIASFTPKVLFDGQLSLFKPGSVVYTDLSSYERLSLDYETFVLHDNWLFNHFIDFNITSNSTLNSHLFNLSDSVDIVVRGPSSNIVFNKSLFNYSIFIPSLDHPCVSCKHYSTVFFKRKADYDRFLVSLIYYWRVNQGFLCSSSPYYHNFYYTIFNKLFKVSSCSVLTDWILFFYDFDVFFNLIAYLFSFFILLFSFYFVIFYFRD